MFTLSFHWFLLKLSFVLIGHCDYFVEGDRGQEPGRTGGG